MKFIANENIPLLSVTILQNYGLDIISVGKDYPGFLDEEIMDLAIKHNRIIITFDRDYGKLVFKKGFKPEAGIIYLRWIGYQPEEPEMLIIK